jgi:DNA-binding XRE family transcriptional regulator
MPALQQAWAACAGEGFTFLILETSVGPKEVRRAREQWWIDHFGEATYNLRRAIKPTPIRKEAPALAPDCHPLTRRRKALGLSMAELADLAGISHVTIWRLETSGKRPTLVVERALEATLSRMERDAVESSKCAG